MDDLTRQISHYFILIKQWFIDLWDTFYSYLSNTLGQNGAKMVVIVGAIALIYFCFFKFINRD